MDLALANEVDPKQQTPSTNILIGACVSLLLSGNLFFIKRLVDDLDDTKHMVTQLHEAVAVISIKMEQFNEKNK